MQDGVGKMGDGESFVYVYGYVYEERKRALGREMVPENPLRGG